ncbi:hypothetical protein UFOVP148_39 [uncultured Caudovirales phage]|uniref:Glycine-rich domain-containing protein n=1 Tax=uncultured Caudovirales phage TaxID=2100421 RepID=A0A6J7W4Y4_9CAUD|nr:hypothetical protein UFOVP148_39 [uncultured Caudovirales phage]
MTFVVKDRVQETCNSPGTGTVTLLGASSGYQAFSAGIGNGNTTFYAIADQSGNNWEVGIGTYASAGNTLARSTVLASSNSGSLVNFSSGVQNVWCDYAAGRAILLDDSGKINAGGVGYIDWASAPSTTVAAGRMWYNNTDGSWNLGMGNGNITQQVGEELFRYGKASAAITDSPLQLVYKTGTVGASGVITFAPAVAGITDTNMILGCATEPIALNGFGRITSYGVIHGITTNGTVYGETWADNDDIYYNPVTGGLTKNLPVAPNMKMYIGTVITAGSGASGSFIVKMGYATYLSRDSDVTITSPANNNILKYNGTNWVNSSTLVPVAVSDQANTSTGYFGLPSGTTAQRPASPANGYVRYNTTLSQNEIYQGGNWNQFSFTYQVEYLIVAGGGGGGGSDCGGGGGAGGLVTGTGFVTVSNPYTITVGSGGATGNPGSTGGSSSFPLTGVATALGGGGGGKGNSGSQAGTSGGSGGGGGWGGQAPGSGTSGQGNNGGYGNGSGGGSTSGGGGGGATAVGAGGAGTGNIGNGGDGSNAYSTWATATSTGASGYYAGGGGAGTDTADSTGGQGGGGRGGKGSPSVASVAGTANTGGGGGGGSGFSGPGGKAGGSGIVIVRYPGSQRGTGGTVVTTGGYTYHTFLSSGTFTG